jgi:two-component system cell cycle sensor histidine kinase/response regulator CckA
MNLFLPEGRRLNMKSPLRILHLEDDPHDAALVRSILEAEGIGCSITWLQSHDDFVAALEHGGMDLVLSDFTLPEFDGMSALKIVHDKWPAIPLIFVSGTLGEERAIDSLKNGATDYVLKDRLARLAPALRRAMQEVEERAESRRRQAALQETEQRLRIIFTQSPLGIALVGADGRPILTNAALQKMLGYTGEELSRMPIQEFTHPDDCARDMTNYGQLMQGALKDYQVENRYIRKDGQVVWARISVSVVPDAAAQTRLAIGMVEDITERRDLEAKFIEAQKMEVIGQLASGVAHDFNNILGVIMGYSELTMQKLGADDELTGCLETIRSAAERAAGLTRQLLIFSRKQTVQPSVLDLNAVVQGLEKMLRRLIDEDIEMKIVPGKDIGRVKADSGYVGQVLMNLAINARDAMPSGGQLTIATQNAALDENYARAHPGALAGDYVMLRVSDTGTGMTEEVKARLFEAFFTTKPKGQGTGLGLATCQTIVQQSGGHIAVDSEVGQGASFQVYFPRVEQRLEVEIKPHPAGPSPRGTETLLVVEDEPSVRHLACDVLEAQGYRVLRAGNGQEGLRVARELNGQPIGLVITDVIMPVMGGKAMAEWLRTSSPNLKILFTSGYTDDALLGWGTIGAGAEFLPKPYSPATLVRKVREMLDAGTGRHRAAAKGVASGASLSGTP